MPTNIEKIAFSKRLELALRRSADSVDGATELALRFNLRHQGNPVSPQTTHKWLNGRSIPTNDKLATIARWLGVDEHWLHYGPPTAAPRLADKERTGKGMETPPHLSEHRPQYGAAPAQPTSAAREGIAQQVIDLALKIQELPPHSRYLVEELVTQLGQDIG